MANVTVTEPVEASAERAWAALSDFGDLSAWARGGEVLRLQGSGSGAVRHVKSAMGVFVERCDALSPAERRLCYSILESPWQLQHYRAQVHVQTTGPQRCTVHWSCDFAVEPDRVAAFERRIERLYRSFIATLRETLADVGARPRDSEPTHD